MSQYQFYWNSRMRLEARCSHDVNLALSMPVKRGSFTCWKDLWMRFSSSCSAKTLADNSSLAIITLSCSLFAAECFPDWRAMPKELSKEASALLSGPRHLDTLWMVLGLTLAPTLLIDSLTTLHTKSSFVLYLTYYSIEPSAGFSAAMHAINFLQSNTINVHKPV